VHIVAPESVAGVALAVAVVRTPGIKDSDHRALVADIQLPN